MIGLGIIIKQSDTGFWLHIGLIGVISIHFKRKKADKNAHI